MYLKTKIIFLFLIGICSCDAQESPINISAKMFEDHQRLYLGKLDGWIFKSGNDTLWANEKLNTSDWHKMQPRGLRIKDIDKNGKIEGWFRLKLKLDSSFMNIPLSLKAGTWAALDVYLDGKFIKAFGKTGKNNSPYKEYNAYAKLAIPIILKVQKEHLLAIHFVDFPAEIPLIELKSETSENGLDDLISLTGPQFNHFYSEKINHRNTDVVNYFLVTLFIFLSVVLLTIQNPKQKILWYFTLVLTMLFSITVFSYLLVNPDLPFSTYNIYFTIRDVLSWIWPSITLAIISIIFKDKILPIVPFCASLFLIIALLSFISRNLFHYRPLFAALLGLSFLVFSIYIYLSSIKSIKGAKWIMIISAILTPSAPIIWILLPEYERFGDYLFYLAFPVSLVIYITQRFKEILIEVQKNAQVVLRLSEEKKDLLATQNETLEKQVVERTTELQHSLDKLKATQTQLIQSEKLASLGELTAGIAHEIQNPLNFVNNFSEMSVELAKELKEEVEKPEMDKALILDLANDLAQNQEKITHHGKRASSIVKGMLEHSRTSTGIKELTDINKIADEFLRLAYHGLRAKDSSFNCDFKTDFDKNLPRINVVSQDIGRVLLNLVSNAFYAVGKREKEEKETGESFKPTVNISTKNIDNQVVIKISDNGTGMSEATKAKIFQPFFTTKPTGEGTGLGLSLSYDIVKTHGGTLECESVENEGTAFVIKLPIA